MKKKKKKSIIVKKFNIGNHGSPRNYLSSLNRFNTRQLVSMPSSSEIKYNEMKLITFPVYIPKNDLNVFKNFSPRFYVLLTG